MTIYNGHFDVLSKVMQIPASMLANNPDILFDSGLFEAEMQHLCCIIHRGREDFWQSI
jgi:hypothetical protein